MYWAYHSVHNIQLWAGVHRIPVLRNKKVLSIFEEVTLLNHKAELCYVIKRVILIRWFVVDFVLCMSQACVYLTFGIGLSNYSGKDFA